VNSNPEKRAASSAVFGAEKGEIVEVQGDI